PAIGIAAGSTWLIAGSMTALLLACAVASRWAVTQVRRSAIGLGQQVAAAVAVLTLTRVTDTFHAYATPGTMLTAGFRFSVDRAALGGVEVEVTVLFADLGGYTAFAETASPSEVVAMLNAVFGAAVPVVLAEGGAVVQFMGDAMMAIFNAPRPKPDHALRVARSALGLQAVVGQLPLAGTRPRFRVGLNSGPAIVGNIGAAEIRNFL